MAPVFFASRRLLGMNRGDVMAVMTVMDDLMMHHLMVHRCRVLGVSGGDGNGDDGDGGEAEQELAHDALKYGF